MPSKPNWKCLKIRPKNSLVLLLAHVKITYEHCNCARKFKIALLERGFMQDQKTDHEVYIASFMKIVKYHVCDFDIFEREIPGLSDKAKDQIEN